MASPLTTNRNSYFNNRKKSRIYTPSGVCNYIFKIIKPFIDKQIQNRKNIIIDTSVGTGNLLIPFIRNYYNIKTIGFDIEDIEINPYINFFLNENYLSYSTEKLINYFLYNKLYIENIALIIQNPPFNNNKDNKKFLKEIKKGKALLPELFLDKTWELFGINIPCICFTPMGFLFNQRTFSKRWKKIRDTYPDISSRITLPLNIFSGVEFHNEIIFFNIPNLKSHYFIEEKYL